MKPLNTSHLPEGRRLLPAIIRDNYVMLMPGEKSAVIVEGFNEVAGR